MSITFLIGLPGSGKTTYIKENFTDLEKFLIYDDRHFGMSDFEEMLSTEKSVIISDPRLCVKKYRDYLKHNLDKGKKIFKYIILNLSLEECVQNITYRESDLAKRNRYIIAAERLDKPFRELILKNSFKK